MGYRNNLRGDHRIGLQLDGNFNFNPRRAIKKTQEGRGILKGQVFLDRNRDGILQATEPGIPRVIVKVKGTRLILRSGADGFFTIQNVREGIHEVQIDAKSLPIGYDLSADITTRVTISEGQITDIPLAIVQRGQIRGFAYEDENGNGEYDRGETRIERAKLRLTSDESDVDIVKFTTSFGQYAFDDLPQGKYNVEIVESEKENIAPGQIFTVELDPELDLMARQNLIIKRHSNLEIAEVEAPNSDVDETASTKFRKAVVTIVDIDTPSGVDGNETAALPDTDSVNENLSNPESSELEIKANPSENTPIPRLKPFTSGRPPDILSGVAPP